MDVEIFGAGMAGLLAGRMLARRNPTIHEVAPSLPNTHSAVLRFRTSVVGDVAGIPFRKVSMIRSALPWKNPVADALAYSYKNTGVRRSDRSIASGDVAAPRWIAPSDFILQLSLGTRILFDVPPNRINDMAKGVQTPIISTIPMPTLMRALDYPSPRPSTGARRSTLPHGSRTATPSSPSSSPVRTIPSPASRSPATA